MKLSAILNKIFPPQLWGGSKGLLWGLTFLTLLWFNTEWCIESSFNGFSTREFWFYNLFAATLLAMPVMLWGARKWQAVIITVLSLLGVANLMYSRTYFSAIPARSYLLAGNMTDYTASAMNTLQWYDVGFLLIVGLAWWIALRRNTPAPKGTKLPYLFYLLVLSLFSWGWETLSGGYVRAYREKADYKYYSQRVPMYTVFGWLAYDMLSTQTQITAGEKQAVQNWLSEHKRLFPPMPVDSTTRYPKSVVLVYVESLESWPIGLKIEGKELTPNLNRIVGDSTATFIPKVVTQVGPGRSIDTQLLENCGLLPLSTIVWSNSCPQNKFYSVNQALTKKNGAESWYLTTAKPSNWNQGATSKALGYTYQYFKKDWKPGPTFGANHKRLGDKPLVEQTVEMMKNGQLLPVGKPGFVHLITMTSHHPFMLPPEFDDLKLKQKYPELLKGYLETVHYTDAAIGTLVEYLRSRDDFEDILVVITGDHEGLANSRAQLAEEFPFVSNERLTPWIALNSPFPGTIDRYVGQVDIYTTFLQLLGLNDYEWQGMGVSALNPRHPGVVITEQGTYGDIKALPKEVADHLQQTKEISELIVRHDLLKK